jgi:hypothetical protein
MCEDVAIAFINLQDVVAFCRFNPRSRLGLYMPGLQLARKA